MSVPVRRLADNASRVLLTAIPARLGFTRLSLRGSTVGLMPTDATRPLTQPVGPAQARWLHNYRMLHQVTGVDPVRWPDADSVEGWHYDWWAVDFAEPGGPRLGVVDVLTRGDPERCMWPHSDAVAAIDSAWPTGPIAIAESTGHNIWVPAALRLPATAHIGEDDDLDAERDMFELAAAAARCPTFLSGEPFGEWWGDLDAVGVGYDTDTFQIVTVHITARLLHPEDCLGEIEWEYVRRRPPHGALTLEDENQLDRVGRLGAMVDEWCPFPEGDPALADAIGNAYDVLVEASELDSDWLLHRLSLDPSGPSWWCRWCPQDERRPAQYVTGGPDGTVSCAAHLHKAAKLELDLSAHELRP